MSSSSGLLCNFEESALNGRLDLVTSLSGFHLQIGKLKITSYRAHINLLIRLVTINQ